MLIVALIVAGILCLTVVALLLFLRKSCVEVAPDQVLIVTGRRSEVANPDGTSETVGYRIVKGGRTFIWPVIEEAETLSLEPLDLRFRVERMRTAEPLLAKMEVEASVAIGGDDRSIRAAAERFLSMDRDGIRRIAQQNLEGHVRAVTGEMSPGEIKGDAGEFCGRVRELAEADMERMGLEVALISVRDLDFETVSE